MYEISLVPDVKAELLKQQKIRNLVILICIVTSIACGVMLAIMVSLLGVQALELSNLDVEAVCRTSGVGDDVKRCNSNYGTAILNFENYEELLTMQSQLHNVTVLNDNKIKMSRLFPLLDALLPTGEYETRISELSADLNEGMLNFDAQGYASNKIGYSALEVFRKNAEKIYYDYGSYMRRDNETGGYVEIPSFCITEKVINGKTYGIYSKGAPGCEAPLIDRDSQEDEDDKGGETAKVDDDEEEEKKEEKETESKSKVEKIYILRSYKNSAERETVKEKGSKVEDGGVTYSNNVGYYFESNCIKYSSEGEGKFDEDATLEACHLLSDDYELVIGDSSYGMDAEGDRVLTFSANIYLNMEVFKASLKHMHIIGPSRQNVTDSYVQVRDMFTEKATELKEGE